MVIWVWFLEAGAVKTPLEEIEPTDADHVTAELLVPRKVAVNRCCALGARVAVLGTITTWTCSVAGALGVLWDKLVELQPTAMVNTSQASISIAMRWRVELNFPRGNVKLGTVLCMGKRMTSIRTLGDLGRSGPVSHSDCSEDQASAVDHGWPMPFGRTEVHVF
jgi:hypothetical protein